MRFIAKYGRYQINFQIDVIEHYATGQSRELQPLLNCEFGMTSMLTHEVVAARAQFINYGLPTEVDGVTTIDPLFRFSVFDTNEFQKQKGLSDEKRIELENFLLARPECGNDYIMVELPRLSPPWPTYDAFRGVRGLPTAQAIAKKVAEDGYALEDVLAYEQQNQNRQDVLDALSEPTPVEDESVVLA